MIEELLGTNCTEKPRKDKLFGICDDQDGEKAYSLSTTSDNWIAIVINNNEESVTFTAIDNCIIVYKPETKNEESTCDGALIWNDSIYLVELKIQATGGWLPKSIEQLENTIKLLSPDFLEKFKYKKAYACNRKHPNFTTIDNELNKRFFREFGFRIDAQREIIIK
jgi:hypothetical protein